MITRPTASLRERQQSRRGLSGTKAYMVNFLHTYAGYNMRDRSLEVPQFIGGFRVIALYLIFLIIAICAIAQITINSINSGTSSACFITGKENHRYTHIHLSLNLVIYARKMATSGVNKPIRTRAFALSLPTTLKNWLYYRIESGCDQPGFWVKFISNYAFSIAKTRIKKAHLSATSSMILVVGLPLPCPALVSMRINTGDSPE